MTVFEWLYFSSFFSLSYLIGQHRPFLSFSLFSLSLSLAEDGMGPPPRSWHCPPAPPAPSTKQCSTCRRRRSGGEGRHNAWRSQMRHCWRRGFAGWVMTWKGEIEWWHGSGRWRRWDVAWLWSPLGKKGGRVRLGFMRRDWCDGPWKKDLCRHDPADGGEQ